MTNNDIIRKIRYIYDFNDDTMIKIFAQADFDVSRAQISNWLKKDDSLEFQEIYDPELATFLNGFINYKRGKREGEQPKPEKHLTNNIILRKIKIALKLKDNDMIELFKLARLNISKHELSAFFRNPKQSQYRACKDQFLRNFLKGVEIKQKNESKS